MSNIAGHEIAETSFWKKRLELAKSQGTLHYSVYLANHTLWERILKAHLTVIEKVIPKGVTVLDLGCGYGRMAEYFPNYLGIDFSPDFIAEAKKLYPDKSFAVEDLTALPYADQAFDWGIVVSVKHMIIGNLGQEAWQKIEQEVKRVCKHALILEYGEREDYDDTNESLAKYEIL